MAGKQLDKAVRNAAPRVMDTSRQYEEDESFVLDETEETGAGTEIREETETEAEVPEDAKPGGPSDEASEGNASAEKETNEAKPTYTNMFAQMMGKLSDLFPEGNRMHDMLRSMAYNLESSLGHTGYVTDYGKQQDQVIVDTTSGNAATGAAAGIAGWVSNEFNRKRTEAEANANADALEAAQNAAMAEDMDSYAIEADDLDVSGFLDVRDESLSGLDLQMSNVTRDLSFESMRKLDGIAPTPVAKADAASDYMKLFEGLQSYSQEALAKIEETYTGEDLERAKEGLATVMQHTVEPLQDALYQDDQSKPFLSPENVAKLDSMKFHGVDQTYSERGFTQAMSAGYEDDLSFGDAYSDADYEQEWQDPQGPEETEFDYTGPYAGPLHQPDASMCRSGRDMRQRLSQRDRVAMAEEKFGHITRQGGQQMQQTGMEL